MRLRYLFIIGILLLFGTTHLSAQHPGGNGRPPMPKIGKISGTILDSLNKKPLEFAALSVSRLKDSSLVGGIITDSKGRFEITELPLGKLVVSINYMGYGTKVLEVIRLTPGEPSLGLGKIYLAPDAALLQTAEITADKQVFQMGLDKKVFNVDKTNLGDSENATEVLRNTPTVEVDFDGAVKIRGSAVQVYINGKPTGLTGDSQAEILDQLPANSIKSVELITNPSAKYDPEGESGIINIVLKKNVLEGFTGSFNASVGTSTWYPFRRYRGGLSLNFRNNKINFFSNFSYNYGQNYSRGYLYRSNYLTDTAYHLEQTNASQNIRNGGMARVGMDYYFDDYNTLTLAARVRPSGGGQNSSILYDNLNENKITDNYRQRITDGINQSMNLTVNAIYSKVFKKKKKENATDTTVTRRDNSKASQNYSGKSWRGRSDGRAVGRSGTMGDKQELVIDLQYTLNDRSNENFFSEQLYDPSWTEINTYPDSQSTLSSRLMNQGTMQVDYTHPIGDKMKVETGYKGNIRWLGEDFFSSSFDFIDQIMLDDINLNNQFEFLEQVHAVYGTFTQKIGKFNYKLGIRLEQTLSTSTLLNTNESFVNNYLSFFPSASASYQLKDNQQIQFGFSRRIQRPSTWQLNPFPEFSDRLNLRYGNPFLQPQFSNSFELSYAKYFKKGHTFMLTGFYRYNTNLMDRLRTVNSEGVSESTYYNFNDSHVLGGELVSRFVPYKWWNISLTGSVYHNRQDATNIGQNYVINAIAGNVNLGMNFVFPFGMRISLYAWYSFPTPMQQGRNNGYTWNSFSISQKVLKNKGTVTLSIRNPVLGGIWSYTLEDTNFYQEGRHQWEAPIFEARFSYRFGKVNVRDSRSKNASRLNKRGEGSENSGGAGGI